MDEKPFFEFNILDFKERDLEELKKFAKPAFDLDTILTTASELKYTRAMQLKLGEWVSNPTEDFVRLLAADLIVGKRFTPALRDQFTIVARRAFEQLISEKINERLKGVMSQDVSITSDASQLEQSSKSDLSPSDAELGVAIATTSEEIEGFYVIRAIARELVPAKRIFMRDAKAYCAILLDDNNRKPICRLRFNNPRRLRIGIFNDKKEELLFDLDSPDDMYSHARLIQDAVRVYL